MNDATPSRRSVPAKRPIAAMIAALWLGVASPQLVPFAEAAPAAPKVALLTSIDRMSLVGAVPFYLGFKKAEYASLNDRLERVFRASFRGTGLQVEAFHHVDQALLHSILHSSEYVGVYWVSHGANVDGRAGPLSTGGLYDSNGFNVTPALAEAHPGLQALALVSCHSARAVAEAGIGVGPGWVTFDGKIDALPGLVEAIRRTRPALAARARAGAGHGGAPTAAEACPERRGIFIHATRRCGKAGPAVLLSAGEKAFAAFPSCRGGELQTQTGYIETEGDIAELDESALEIVASTGTKPITALLREGAPELGELSFRTALENGHPIGAWRPLEIASGETLGVYQKIYAYGGSMPRAESVMNYRPFRCAKP